MPNPVLEAFRILAQRRPLPALPAEPPVFPSKAVPPAPPSEALDSVYAKYPALLKLGGVNVIDSRTKGMSDNRQLEYYAPDERDNPRRGRSTVEVLNPAIHGQAYEDAIAADLLHGLKNVDPKWKSLREQFLQSLTMANKSMDRRAYVEAGDTRPFDQWMEDNRGDAYLRGYLFPDSADEWRKGGVYNEHQKQLLEQMRAYLSSGSKR